MPMQRGFSLVELSIVLVILGLLTGGILGGQSLIKAAELRAVATELDAYQASINAFRDKYRGTPGDFDKAGRFWGYANTGGGDNCSDPAADTGTGTDTCDGNGNGRLEQNYETFRFWQHLANAGLVQGEYTGVAGSGGTAHSLSGENVPTSKFSNASWGVTNFEDYPGFGGFYFDYNYGTGLHIGSEWFVGWNTGPVFTPEEAWSLDTKIDDGKPTGGLVIASQTVNCTDATGPTDVSGTEYMLSETGINCSLFFTRVIRQ